METRERRLAPTADQGAPYRLTVLCTKCARNSHNNGRIYVRLNIAPVGSEKRLTVRYDDDDDEDEDDDNNNSITETIIGRRDCTVHAPPRRISLVHPRIIIITTCTTVTYAYALS